MQDDVANFYFHRQSNITSLSSTTHHTSIDQSVRGLIRGIDVGKSVVISSFSQVFGRPHVQSESDAFPYSSELPWKCAYFGHSRAERECAYSGYSSA